MNEPESMEGALRPVREAAQSLVSAVGHADERLSSDRASAPAILAALDELTRLRERAGELIARVDDASVRLAELEQELYDPRHFDAGRWPERRLAISEKLQASPLDGATSWLTAWARAFLAGCPEEAERLVAEPFALPAEAAWYPDRFGAAADALQARSVERLAPLLRYLADGAPLGGHASAPADVRSLAAVLHGRLVRQAGRDGGQELLERAEQLAGHDAAAVLAARAALTRMKAAAADAEAVQAPDAAGAEAAQPDDAASLARQAWQTERCPAAAVELFYAERAGDGKASDALASARALVGELPFAAGQLYGMFDVLILPVPGAIWAAAAERAVGEGELDAARRLADQVKSDADPLLLAELADLRVRIAEESGEDDRAVADLLDAAGLAALTAEQPRRAIVAYEKALARVSDHRSASLHLAEALVSDGWAKPLRQVEPQLRRALELLTEERSRRPLDAETSWSLLTESYLHSLLAGAVTPAVRAAELWQAPLAAARAIAFDPSMGRNWCCLADTLSNLRCRRAALVLCEHAFQLTPDDIPVRDARLTALGNLGHVEAALSVLGQAELQNPNPWYSAVRAFLLRIKADERPDEAPVRLKDALTAADEAVRGLPDNLWPHQIRAELLLDLGAREQATEEFEHIWRESRLDEADDLASASQAAAELGLGPDALSLGEQAVGLAMATVEFGNEYTVRGIARILPGAPAGQSDAGLSDLEAAAALVSTRPALKDLRTRVGRLAEKLGAEPGAIDLGSVMARISERAAQIESEDAEPPAVFIGAELDRVAVNPRYDPEVAALAALAAALAAAFCLIAAGDPAGLAALHELAGQHPEYPELSAAAASMTSPTPDAGGSAATQPAEVEIHLPPSWFAGLSEPLEHEIIKRFVPDVRARLRRRLGVTLPGVSFRDDVGLEPAGFRIQLRGTNLDEGRVSLDRWYLPTGLRAAVTGRLQAEVGPATDVADLDFFPAPAHPDSLTALVAWSPLEVVARHLERAFIIDQAVVNGNLAEAEAQYRGMLDVRERRLGGDDPATLMARNDLVGVLQWEGKPAEAEAECRVLVDARTRLKGADDTGTLVARQQLANLLSELGRFADAEVEQRAIVTACERLFGGDHGTTLSVRYALAGVFHRQGRLADAEAEYRAVLDGQTQLEGADQPDTLQTREQLAAVLADLGRPAEAEAEYRAVHAARERLAPAAAQSAAAQSAAAQSAAAQNGQAGR
jgi:hypothetical protein